LVPYGEKETHTAVEVHWNIVGGSHGVEVEASGLWERSRPAQVLGVDVAVLAPEDLLLHLCVHAVVLHRFAIQLRDVYDLAGTVRRYRNEMDWAAFADRAAQYGLGKGCYLCLELARQMFGAPVESGILRRLRSDLIDDCLVDLLKERVLGGPASDMFRALWHRREVRPDGLWKTYCDVTLGAEMLWGVTESGFHEQEVEDGHAVRWTNGAARLEIPVDGVAPPRGLMLHLWIG